MSCPYAGTVVPTFKLRGRRGRFYKQKGGPREPPSYTYILYKQEALRPSSFHVRAEAPQEDARAIKRFQSVGRDEVRPTHVVDVQTCWARGPLHAES